MWDNSLRLISSQLGVYLLEKFKFPSVYDKHLKLEHSIESNIMEAITKIPGLRHISEDIFKLLDRKSLMNCRSTNLSWKNVLEQSTFWLKKMKMEGWKALAKQIVDQQLAKDFARDMVDIYERVEGLRNLPSDVQSKWRALSQELENDHQAKEFVFILIKTYNNIAKLLPLEVVVCLKEANKYPDLMESIFEHEDFHTLEHSSRVDFRIFVTRGTNYKISASSIDLAAYYGHLNIVKHLIGKQSSSQLTYLNGAGWTPIHCAAYNGHLDVVKFLVGVIDTPNNYNTFNGTPIDLAKERGHVEVQKFLENHCKYLITKVKKGLLHLSQDHKWNKTLLRRKTPLQCGFA